jgi:dihydropyrimidine dehydrogenase (NAD+) subunit PreA
MTGASATVVEAVASGKDAADRLDRYLRGERTKPAPKRAKSDILLSGANQIPVPLSADFFGRKILSPILLSAAPHTDGYREMRAAYERGWAGGVMKTAFDNVPIHIPSEYMFVLGQTTYGNCDNVSGHSLDRVCREIERLVKEYPDRLTLGSTGGPVTGNDASDRTTWQANTRKLERAGAMGVEYSFSCPQGGDGTKGDMVSQNAELTAKIVDWILEAGDGAVPKLFKLSGAVTAIEPIVNGIGEVLKKYPGKKAGVTLANSFPSLSFRTIENSRREEGVVIGMSGDGVLPITNLILAKVSGLGVPVSANGGVMDYRSAARFLALGARTVQCCTIVMKHGLGIIDELHSGLSYLMQEKGFRSVGELIGSALPDPVRPFERLPATKTIPDVTPELCYHCGNCARCPYQAIVMNDRIVPLFDAALCVGCSLCAQKCFSGAIAMRPRTKIERDAFHED